MAYYAPGTMIPSKLHLIQGKFEPSGNFRFLDLPGEIRNKIYDLAFQECVVDVRMSNQPQFHDEIIDRPFVDYQRQPYHKHSMKFRSGARKPMEKQLGIKDLQSRSNSDTKLLQQAPVLLQEQSRAVSHKYSKPQQRRRRRVKEGPSRMYHDVLSLVHAKGGNPGGYHVPFNFLLSGRQIYNEALCVMYAKTAFRITLALDRFLTVTPLRALQAVQGLDISHATYGEPELTENRKFKLSSDKKWLTTCKQIRDKMTNLKTLRLRLLLNDWPIQLGIRDEWAQAILCLRRDGLDRVDATLIHAAFSDEKLNEAARNLEMTMMNKQGRMAKFAEEKKLLEAKKKNAEPKARKVLVIKMDNVPKAQKVQKV